MPDLTLAQASTIVDAALAKGHEMKLKPLTVAVLDAGGHPRALKVEDGSSLLRHQIATGKAWGALGMGMASRKLVDRAKNAPAFTNSLTQMAGGLYVPVPGGVLIRDKAGALLGAVGISGDTSDNDEACAEAGIAAAGLVADAGKE
jgi:uncharacterized protein GlcG (DUF336 family)